jgi:transcriptional regulator with XRE-family HTH domain
VPEVRSPTLRRRELGALLRARRLELGLTVEQVAEHLLCSPSKVSRMETGQRGATPRDVRDLCALYGIADVEESKRLMTLAIEGKQQGWWESYGLPPLLHVALEHDAASIKIFNSAMVPVLLQTADYARAIHEASVPQLSPGEIEQRIREQTNRQQVLTRGTPPRMEIVIDESVMHRKVGSAPVMKAQLRRIVELCQQPNITLQIMPFEGGAHPALESDFVILELEGHVPGVVYVEGLIGQIYLEREHDIQRYLQVFGRLRNMASSVNDSIDIVTKSCEAYQSVAELIDPLPPQNRGLSSA